MSIPELKDWLSRPDFSHVSYRRWCRVDMLYVYRRDETSPSGVICVGGLEESPEALAALEQAGKRPIMGGQMGEMAARAGMGIR